MKNTKGYTLVELVIVIAIIGILAVTFLFAKKIGEADKNVKEKTNIEESKFSEDGLYLPEKSYNKMGVSNTNIVNNNINIVNIPERLFHAKLMGEMTCEGFDGIKLKVYEFCYNGIKYFAIEGGYMAPKMVKTSNGVVHYKTCGEN